MPGRRRLLVTPFPSHLRRVREVGVAWPGPGGPRWPQPSTPVFLGAPTSLASSAPARSQVLPSSLVGCSTLDAFLGEEEPLLLGYRHVYSLLFCSPALSFPVLWKKKKACACDTFML